MKTILRNIAIYGFTLFLLPQIIPGFYVNGAFWTFLTGGIVLSMLFLILKPILSIISFPVNMISLGIFNVFINALLLYLLTVFVTEISVTAFTLTKVNFLGFIIPEVSFNTFFAYVYSAFILTIIVGGIKWLMK